MPRLKSNTLDHDSVKQIIRSQVTEQPFSECWEWQGKQQIVPNSPMGYGIVHGALKKKFNTGLVHRISYHVFNHPVPKDILVRHRCDNKICCNPAHLELGDNTQNQADRNRALEDCSQGALLVRKAQILLRIEKLQAQLQEVEIEIEKRFT